MIGRPAKDEKERFKMHVHVSDSGCHEWKSTIKHDGYGQFTKRDWKTIRAHRYAWEMVNGNIPDGALVLHKCDNRRCVNVEHLFLGGYSDNAKDMVSKGRNWGNRKVTDEQAWKIRDLLDCGFSQAWISDLFCVNQTTISRLKLGKTDYANG